MSYGPCIERATNNHDVVGRQTMFSKIFRSFSASKDDRTLPRIPEDHATAIIDDASYPLKDWNAKGLMVAQYEGRYGVGSSLDVTLAVPLGRNNFRFAASAKVVRRDKRSKQLAAVFTSLDTKVVDQLAHIARAKTWV